MSVVCIIPARGGSKGIPRKNIMPVAGHPLISWAVRTALGSKHIDRVVVSTDDDEIADIAVQCGADVIRRPDSISGDGAASEEALLHALEHFAEAGAIQPDTIVFMQCTSPLTLASDLDAAFEKYLSEKADVVFAATASHAFLWREGPDGCARPVNHDMACRPMRQERQPEYRETGSFYVMRAEGLRKHKHRFFGKVLLHEIPAERATDIDDAVDLERAERLLEKRSSEQ